MSCCAINAQVTMEQVLRNAPDGAVVDYMKQNDWLDCIDYHEAGMLENGATDALDSKIVLKDLKPNYAEIKIGDALVMQLGLLDSQNDEDSTFMICMVKTFCIDSCLYSRIEIRDSMWKSKETKHFVELPEWISLFSKPDTMSVEEYNRILLLPLNRMYCIEMEKDGNTLYVSPSNTTLNAEERKQFESILLKRNVKWISEKRKIY